MEAAVPESPGAAATAVAARVAMETARYAIEADVGAFRSSRVRGKEVVEYRVPARRYRIYSIGRRGRGRSIVE